MNKLNGYVKEDLLGPALSGALAKYMQGVMRNVKERKGKPQVKAYVGDRVWCRFENSPKNVINPGVVFDVSITRTDTIYTVLSDNLYDFATFTDEDFGKEIFIEEES